MELSVSPFRTLLVFGAIPHCYKWRHYLPKSGTKQYKIKHPSATPHLTLIDAVIMKPPYAVEPLAPPNIFLP